MGLSKKIYYKSVSAIPIRLLKAYSSVKILLPYHHVVSDERLTHICHLYSYKNPKQFQKDLDYLLQNFNPIHPSDLLKAIQERKEIPKNSFLLTFDDGFREASDIIQPMLLAKGVPALFFLNPAFLDNRELCYRNKLSLIIEELGKHDPQGTTMKELYGILGIEGKSRIETIYAIYDINYNTKKKADVLGDLLGISFADYLQRQKPYLTRDQIFTMVKNGFSFGGHSMDHPNYRDLSIADQIEQTLGSCDYVRDEFHSPHSFFSFPHDDIFIKQLFFDELSNVAGSGVDLFFGTQNQKSEPENRILHRFNAERPGQPVESLIKGMLAYNLIKRHAVRR